MNSLTLENLPSLPQSVRLARFAHHLWEHDDVRAIWVGGSIAAGTADEYSDVDLCVAVRPDVLEHWRQPDFQTLFDSESVGGNMFPFGDDAFLHHLALSNGDIIDFWVQSTERDLDSEHVLVLGCRDAAYQRRLESVPPLQAFEFPRAEPAAVRQMVVDFWINSLKHRKVLHRKLDLLAVVGVGMERSLLLRLWHIQATGRDNGTVRVTIHSLTETIRALENDLDPRRWRLQGASLTTRAEIITAIEGNRNEVSHVGNAIADTLGFEYPASLELTVRQTWDVFLDAGFA